MKNSKVVLFSNGGFVPHNIFLIRKFQKEYKNLIVFITKPINKKFSKLIYQNFKIFIFRLLGVKAYYMIPPKMDNLEIVDSHNSDYVYEKVKEFNPDFLCFAWTKKIDSRITSLAKYSINVHAGLVPIYKGTYNLRWTSLESNIDNFFLITHNASDIIDGGNILDSIHLLPNRHESFLDFSTRVHCNGAILLIQTINNIKRIKPISQPINIPNRDFYNKHMTESLGQQAIFKFNTKNFSTFKKNVSKKSIFSWLLCREEHLQRDIEPQKRRFIFILNINKIFQQLKWIEKNFKTRSLEELLHIEYNDELKNCTICIDINNNLDLKRIIRAKSTFDNPNITIFVNSLLFEEALKIFPNLGLIISDYSDRNNFHLIEKYNIKNVALSKDLLFKRDLNFEYKLLKLNIQIFGSWGGSFSKGAHKLYPIPRYELNNLNTEEIYKSQFNKEIFNLTNDL